MKSKAMVVTAPEQMELQEFELKPTPADHVLVKTSVTSVCSTDVKVFKGRTPFVNYPLVMGQEVAGEVVEIGSLAKQWHPFAARRCGCGHRNLHCLRRSGLEKRIAYQRSGTGW